MSDWQRIQYAEAVAIVWINGALEWGDMQMDGRVCAHPLSCVRSALAGETDPGQLGCRPEELAAALKAVKAQTDDPISLYREILAV
jgi:hypothetical protein